MDQASVVGQLAWLTAGLKPAPETTHYDLQTAREIIARSLLHSTADAGIATAQIAVPPSTAPSPADVDALVALVDGVGATMPGGAQPLVFRRNLPSGILANPAFTPMAQNGMQVRTIGPFIDQLGALHWFDIVPPAQQMTITRAGATTPFLSLPLSLPSGTIPTTLQVGAGSLWIAAPLLASTAPSGSFTGIAISGGTLKFSTAPTAVAGGLQIPTGATLTLTVTPDGAAGPIGGTGPGSDAGQVEATIPATVTIGFTSSAGEFTAVQTASLSVYGNDIDLAWHAGAPIYEAAFAQIFVPLTPSTTAFAVGATGSDVFQLKGSGKIFAGAWVWPVATTTAAQLGAASSAGLLSVLIGQGLSASWKGMTATPARFGASLLECAGGMLTLIGVVRSATRARATIKLWSNAPPPPNAYSSVDLIFPDLSIVHYTSISDFNGTKQTEIVISTAALAAHIDRPVAADGSRLGPNMTGVLAIFETASRTGLLILGEALAIAPPISIALRNALMVTTPPAVLLVVGTFGATPTELKTGGLLLVFGLETLLPSLPDPYAANFLPVARRRDGEAAPISSVMLATVVWSPTTPTRLDFIDTTLSAASFRLQGLSPSPTPPVTGQAAIEDAEWLGELDTLFDDTFGGTRPELFLLDVSSNVDQFGVAVGVLANDRAAAVGGGGSEVFIAGLDLVAPAQALRVFTPPAVQWEPVVTIQNPNVLPSPFPSPIGFRDDGGPTLLGVNDVTLVPVAPAPLLDEIVTGYADGNAGAVRLTLPFGMSALSALPARAKHEPILFRRPGLTPIRPSFAPQNMTGGWQLALTAPANLFLTQDSPSLPGAVVQLRNLVDAGGNRLIDPRSPPPPGGLQLSVLGPAVDEIFNSEFAPGAKNARIPMTRYDISGYGASSFSAWTEPGAVPPAVVQARFNMIVGRASHEVVQVKSVLYPWGAIVVRTITIDRQDDAMISRYDSGWVAATPGVFETAGIVVHPGAVTGAYNIREIRDTAQSFSPGGGGELLGVYFDADIAITGVKSGANADGHVPSTGLFGYVQTAPANTPLTAAQLAALISARGALGGPVDCTISVASTAQTMRVLRVEIGNAPHGGFPEFAASARGSPVLPQPGAWTVVARTDAVSEPTPVDPDLGVPLIRQGQAGGPAPTTPWRIAEAADLWTPGNPSMDYCLMHTTDSSRVLFPRPKVANGASAFTSDVVPLLADGFALMGATSICPRQDACLALPDNTFELQINDAGAFTLANVASPFAPSKPMRTLSTGSVGTIGFEYADEHGTQAQIFLAITPNAWEVGLKGVNVRLDLSPFDGLIRTAGDFQATSAGGTSMQNGRLALGSVLQPLQELLSFLTHLGLPNPLAMSFANAGSTSSTSYKLKATLGFALPSPLLPALTPLLTNQEWKIGLSVKIGFGNSASSAGDLFSSSAQWSFSFSFSGNIQWAIFPPIFAGGLLGLGIAANFPAGTRPQTEQLSFQIGVIASVGGDIVPNVVRLQGSVSFSFMLVIGLGPMTTVSIGCGLVLSVSGQILSGLVGITFTASATGLVTVTDPKSVQATFDVSVDVQLCWFLDISFDVAFQYTQSI
jgi:hypothetical protein